MKANILLGKFFSSLNSLEKTLMYFDEAKKIIKRNYGMEESKYIAKLYRIYGY